MGGKVQASAEEKARMLNGEYALARQGSHGLKLELERPAETVEDDDDNDERPMLSGLSNVYMDSPRVGRIDDNASDDEIRRRHRVGVATVAGLFLSILVCVVFLHYLSHHESFSALPPTQQRFMASTTAAGARDSLEWYTSGVRHTGTAAGDQDAAKWIRSRAIDFGIEERFIKLEDFDILTNEPETLKLHVEDTTIKHDFMAEFAASLAGTTKKSVKIPFPPFHLYSKNGSAAGRLVYAHFGRSEDYAALAKASVDVTQCVVLVRMGGDISLPAKVVLAAKHGAIGVLTYHDPFDDGAARGKSYPDGPWRVSSEASFGSVYMGNGDPSTPDGSSGYAEDRISVDEVFSSNNTYNLVPQVVSMPISATVAGELLLRLSLSSNTSTMPTATDVFTATSWHGGAAVNGNAAPYRVGPSDFTVSLENKNKYTLKKVWNVLITVPGSREADRYVMVGAQRDALNAGAVSPGSGNAVFIEMLRAIGDLLTNGWVPHRTLLFASFDGEQFGSVGSSEWIDRHFSHLGGRGVVYLHLRDVVRGAGALQCEAAASLRKNIYRLATEIVQPKAQVAVASFFSGGVIAKTVETPGTDTSSEPQLPTHQPHHRLLAREEETGTDEINNSDIDAEALPLNNKTFSHEVLKDSGASVFSYWLADTRKQTPTAKLPHIDLPGSDNKISPFLARLGIPSLELGFSGGYFGVEGTRSDSLEWVKKFADPNFLFHRAAAQLYGSIMLSFSDSLFLQYDFIEVARDLRRGEAYLLTALQREARSTQLQAAVMNRLALSIKEFEEAAAEVTTELKEMRDAMVNLISGELVVDLKKVREMNTRLLMTEKAFMLPAGLPKMPWLKHALYGISEYNDYRVGYFPSVAQEIVAGNAVTIKRELIRLCQTIEQAADILSTPVL